MIRLPEELETELWHDIERIEGELNVKYITSVERLAIKRGMEQGLAQDREDGRKQGHEEGRREGRTEGGAAVLGRQLGRRFGPLPAAVAERPARATPEQIERWAKRILDAGSLEDAFAVN